MLMKVENGYVVVNFSQPCRMGQYSVTVTGNVRQFTPDKQYLWMEGCPEIIFATDNFGLENVRPIFEPAIGKPLEDYVKMRNNQEKCNGFIDGYIKAKEDLFTLEDMKKAFGFYAFNTVSQQPYNEAEFEDAFKQFIKTVGLPKVKLTLIDYKPTQCDLL
jgi:hypothetical protein